MVPAPLAAFEITPLRKLMTMPFERWSFQSRLVMSVFWLVAIATQINFNHVSNMIVGTGWFVTLGLALCGAFLVLAVRVPFRRALGPPGYLIAATMIFYLVIGISVALITDAEWRADPRLSLHVGLALIVIVASGLGAWVVLQRIGAEMLLARILAIKAVMCILILATPLLVEHLYHSMAPHYREISQFRFSGTFSGPNAAGIAACQAVVLALSLLNSRYRRFARWVAILGSVAVIMTFSRAAILALALVVVFFLWSSTSDVHSGRRRSATVWLVPMVIAGMLGLAAISLEHLPLVEEQLARIKWIVNSNFSEIDNYRFRIWPLAMSLIAESPLFGHGLSQFHSIEYAPVGCNHGRLGESIVCSAHNFYMILWGEAGIVPLVLFLLFIGALLRIRLVLPKSIAGDTVTGWTLVLAVESMTTDDVPFFPWTAFIIGLSCALAAYVARESRARGAERASEAQPASVRTTPDGAASS